MYKNIVRYHMVGEPVIIGARPIEEKTAEEITEDNVEENSEVESKPEPKPESASGIPQEILDKVFAEIEEIERKTKLTEKILQEAQATKEQADEIKAAAEKDAREIKHQAHEIKQAAQQEAQEIKRQADELMRQAEDQAEDLEKKAHATLEAAQKESEKIVEDTRREAEQLLEKVHKEGYDEGYKEGREEGIKDGKEKIQEDLDETIKRANAKAQKTIQDAKEQTSEYFIRAEDDIAKIVMRAIEKILPQHFLDVPQVILPVVREAIGHVRDQKQIKVHVEPYSYDLILMARSEFQSMLSDGTAIIEIVSDEALKPGDCVIETPNGGVDARLSTQIGLMKKSIEGILNN